MQSIDVDIVIVGGGIAGMWLHHLLRKAGRSVLLLEKDSLGTLQTLGSQGMIHGGQRYHLQGTSSDHGDKIAAMPRIWNKCLAGHGEIDLSSTQKLAENQYMWSPGGLGANVTAFMASKAMNSKVKGLSKNELPEIFAKSSKFKGSVYQMDESVIEIKSLLNALRASYADTILQAEVKSVKSDSQIVTINILQQTKELSLTCRKAIFTAGIGNEIAVKDLKLDAEKPQTQRRPLKQIMIKEVDLPLYAHCITTDPRPRMTVTAHPLANGKFVWYLGGIVAEFGLHKSDSEAIANAKKEIQALFPWMDWSDKEWSCLYIDRAEPYFDQGFFKSGPEVLFHENVAIAWPTKLTFAPALARQLLEWLDTKPYECKHQQIDKIKALKHAEIGLYPWETAAWQR